jgi:hypothetical protein
MKKILCLLLFCNSFYLASAQGNSDPMMAWVQYGTSTWGTSLGFELYAKKSSWGLGQQFFAANVKNGVPYKLRVKGELYAKLICGNESVSKLDFTIDSYARMTKAEMGTMNVSYLSDATGLISSADKEECTGNDIIVGGKKVGVSRIQALGVRNIKVEAEMGKGGDWVTMRSDGTFIEPTGNKPSTGNTSNQTLANNNGQPKNANVNSGSPQQSKNQQSAQANTGSSNIASQRAPQSNPVASQQAILQSMVSQDLLKAQQSTTSPILQSMYLSNARLAAVAAGDQSTVSRIAQQQQQLRLQSQQQLTESVTQLAGTVFSLISAAQDRKREEAARMERWRVENEQRKNAEALKIAEIEQKTAPERQLALEQLEQRMNSESVGYGNAATAADKVSYALSWLWKWNESIKIAGTKPEVKASYSNPTNVSVVSEGYVNASSQSLLSAVELTENLTMDNLAGYGIVWKEVPNLLYPHTIPSTASKKYKDKLKFWYEEYNSRKKITLPDKIARRYTRYDEELNNFRKNYFNKGNYWLVPLTGIYYTYINDYPKDSIECVRNGEKAYYYRKNIYNGGFVTQKILETHLLHANLLLDSAIGFNNPATLSRSAEIYRSAFKWYFNGPVRWLKVETQPALLIRESMWRYALAVAATRKNMPPSENTEDPHAAITEAFVKQFEQYLSLPISQVTEPMKLDK